MERQKKKTSLRAKMMLFNSCITLAALILCGLVFVVLVWFNMEKSARHDLEFFMTQTNENLNAKTEYLEQIVYNLRDNDSFMETIKGEQYGLTTERMQEIFVNSVDISNRKNAAKGSLPMVEQVFLFVGEESYHVSYFAMIEAQEIEQAAKAVAGYERFIAGGSKYLYEVLQDGEIFLFYPLYDEEMEAVGTLAFVMQKGTFESLAEDVFNYQGSIWALYDSTGQIITEKNGEEKTARMIAKKDRILNRVQKEWIGEEDYFLEEASLCMNLRSCIAIPGRQTFLVLYESMKLYAALIFVITFAAAVLFVLVIYRMTKPLKELSSKLQSVREGEFDTKLPYYDTKEFYDIGTAFNEMTAYINQLVNQVYEKQISMKEMELKFYQTQMNPHFMFNVLNTIGLQAKMDQNEEVFQMISSFSRLIQAKIYREDKEKVRISQELEYVRYYLYLQKNRFGDRLDYSINLEEEALGGFFIPKLCIQLIAENAVVHGIEPKVGKGMVRIEIRPLEEDISIDIIDNGIGFLADGEIELPLLQREGEDEHNHVGLNNAHKIIRLAYGEAYGLRIFSKRGEGATVSIRIPLDRGEG